MHEPDPVPATVMVLVAASLEEEPQRVQVAAEPTGTPGLVIVPIFDRDGHLSGGFAISHAASGYAVGYGYGDTPAACRRIATALGTTPVDWTMPDVGELAEQIQAHAGLLSDAVDNATAPDPTEEENLDPAYGGTLRGMRQILMRSAHRGQLRFEELLTSTTSPMSPEEQRDSLIAHGCALHGYALAAVLGMLGERNRELAERAAWLVISIGNDGGGNEDLPWPPTEETPASPAPAAAVEQPGEASDGPA